MKKIEEWDAARAVADVIVKAADKLDPMKSHVPTLYRAALAVAYAAKDYDNDRRGIAAEEKEIEDTFLAKKKEIEEKLEEAKRKAAEELFAAEEGRRESNAKAASRLGGRAKALSEAMEEFRRIRARVLKSEEVTAFEVIQ